MRQPALNLLSPHEAQAGRHYHQQGPLILQDRTYRCSLYLVTNIPLVLQQKPVCWHSVCQGHLPSGCCKRVHEADELHRASARHEAHTVLLQLCCAHLVTGCQRQRLHCLAHPHLVSNQHTPLARQSVQHTLQKQQVQVAGSRTFTPLPV